MGGEASGPSGSGGGRSSARAMGMGVSEGPGLHGERIGGPSAGNQRGGPGTTGAGRDRGFSGDRDAGGGAFQTQGVNPGVGGSQGREAGTREIIFTPGGQVTIREEASGNLAPEDLNTTTGQGAAVQDQQRARQRGVVEEDDQTLLTRGLATIVRKTLLGE